MAQARLMFSVLQVFNILFDVILLIKDDSSLDIRWKLDNTDTDRTCYIVFIKWVNFIENMSYFFAGTNETVRFIQVSVEQVPTIVKFSAYIVAYL